MLFYIFMYIHIFFLASYFNLKCRKMIFILPFAGTLPLVALPPKRTALSPDTYPNPL